MARASDFIKKETCSMRTCEVEMSRRSLHQPSLPRRAGPDLEKWTWTMEIMMSRMKQNNLRNSGEFQLHASPQSTGRNISDKSCCVCTVVRSVCESKGNRSTAQETDSQGIGKERTGWTPNLLRRLPACLRQELRHRCLRRNSADQTEKLPRRWSRRA